MHNCINKCLRIGIIFIYIFSTQSIITNASIPLNIDVEENIVVEEIVETIATEDELLDWLSNNQQGNIELTNNIEIENLSYVHYSKQQVNINTKEFSIIINGEVSIASFGGINIFGNNTQQGILTVNEGGNLSVIDSVDDDNLGIVIDNKSGFSAYQEEGSGLLIGGNVTANNIHYATAPFISYWYETGDTLLVSKDQIAADILPKSLNASVIFNGKINDQEINVLWDLENHGDKEKKRLRFTTSGIIEGYSLYEKPVITVAYDDYPITFKDIRVEKNPKDLIVIKCNYTNPILEDANVISEYSFDGKNWKNFESSEAQVYASYVYLFNAGDQVFDDVISWDTKVNPYIYISLYYNDGHTNQYSNTIQISYNNLQDVNDIGGGRGGGEVIIPTIKPEPEPTMIPTAQPTIKPTKQPTPRPTKESTLDQTVVTIPGITPIPTQETKNDEYKNDSKEENDNISTINYKNIQTLMIIIFSLIVSIGVVTLYFKIANKNK